MAIGTAAAIAIAASAGASVAGSAMAANAAKGAAKTQAASADRANALHAQTLRQQQATMAPFTGAGTGAVNQLSRLLGVPEGATFASPGMGFGGPGGYAGPPPGIGMNGTAQRLMPRFEMLGDTGMAGGGGMAVAPGYGAMPVPRRPMVPGTMAPSGGPVFDGRSPLRIEDFIAR